MSVFIKFKCALVFAAVWMIAGSAGYGQTNLLLNGDFEEVNTCTEYKSECGVEGWFYLKDVKVQMLLNETNIQLLGANSYGISTNWAGYKDFTPVIGAILPCGLQKDKAYTFKGLISARLNPKLVLRPGFCVGEKFYVPGRPFSKTMKPQVIGEVKRVPNTEFFSFELSFVADGNSKYLTFGTYIEEDTVGAKKRLIGTQTISMVLDNFKLVPADPRESFCPDYLLNKGNIYDYNYRHKEMDYSLYAKGEIGIELSEDEQRFTTVLKDPPPPPPKPDTLKLGDLLFDFNKANLKSPALTLLTNYFLKNKNVATIDSIFIEGHTDSVGSDERNMSLSLARSRTVLDWLVLNSIVDSSAVRIRPFGRSKPVASNKTPAGRAQNRRVEMIVFRKIIK